MQHFYLSAYTLSPLAIRADHATSGAETVQYIPGTTLLGSLAATHRLLRPRKKDEFEEIFLRERVQFPHLYPASFAEDSQSGIAESHLPVFPLPKTAQSCKRFPGFRPLSGEDADEERHGIRDSLLDWAMFSLLDGSEPKIAALLVPFERHTHCTERRCQQVMDHVDGYYRRADFDPSQRMKAQVHTRLQTRTGINREWGTVEERILYNREVFEQGMPFWGEVLVPDDLAEAFKSFVDESNKEEVVHIGTGRTRGLGRVSLEMREAASIINVEDFAAFKERLFAFNRVVQEQAREVKVNKPAPFYLTLTLHSASILCDVFLRYCSTIDGTMLGSWLNKYLPQEYPAITWRKIYQATGVQRISGWNELWGTPKSMEYALEMGSTFLFACSHEPDNMLIQALQVLEEEGIGRRRAEGFGRIRISDPFHLEGEQA